MSVPSHIGRTIFLDSATTPIAPEVAAAMSSALTALHPAPRERSTVYHNDPGDGAHWTLSALLFGSRETEMSGERLLDGGEIYPTNGATHAVMLGIQAVADMLPDNRRRILVVATEPARTLAAVQALAADGFDTGIVPVEPDGRIDLDQLAALITDSTGLVVVSAVNRETGIVHPIAKIADLVHKNGGYLLCDAACALGRVDFAPDKCDLIAVTAHRIHGPRGIGALWTRLKLRPQGFDGVRIGPYSPILAAGFGAALYRIRKSLYVEQSWEYRPYRHCPELWAERVAPLEAKARAMLSGWTRNGGEGPPTGILSLRREGVNARRLKNHISRLIFGTNHQGQQFTPNSALTAMGLDEGQMRSTIRIGITPLTREDDLIEGLELINHFAENPRNI